MSPPLVTSAPTFEARGIKTPPSGENADVSHFSPPPRLRFNQPITRLEIWYKNNVISFKRPLFHRVVRFPYGVVSW